MKRRTPMTLLITGAAVLILAPMALAGWGSLPHSADGQFFVTCEKEHSSQDDPIVFPGTNDGSPHKHDFYGNPSVDENSSTASLQAETDTSCTHPFDRSALWTPRLFKMVGMTEVAMTPKDAVVYYRPVNLVDTADLHLPVGLQMVAGKKNIIFEGPWGMKDVFKWTCLAPDNEDETWNTSLVLLDSCNDGNGPLNGDLQLQVRFPNCWDGVNLQAPAPNDTKEEVWAQAHVQYSWEEDQDDEACPDGWVPMLTVVIDFEWNVTQVPDDLSTIMLHDEPHADFGTPGRSTSPR